MIYDINHIWSAEMKWNWRNDRRSERNLCNCVKNSEKKKQKKPGLQRSLNTWPRDTGAMFPWKKWVLMIYEINRIWTAEMKWKWRNHRRSERNLCNCVKKPEKKFRTSTGFEPVTSRYWCSALPTELWSHWRWEQVNCGFICSRERNES